MMTYRQKSRPRGRLFVNNRWCYSERHRRSQFLDRVGLYLANTFRRDTVFVGQLVQRQLVLRQPAALDDMATAIIEGPDGGSHALGRVSVEVCRLDKRRWISIRAGQVRSRRECALVVGVRRRIEHRVVAAGPTPIDAMANTALFLGLFEALMRSSAPLELRLPFDVARRNFYQAARHGLEASVQWLDGEPTRLADLLTGPVLDLAAEGLAGAGLGAAEAGVARAAADQGRTMETAGIKELLYDNYEHPRWDEVSVGVDTDVVMVDGFESGASGAWSARRP